MTGIEKIINYIKEDAASAAEAIKSKAKADSDEIIAAAKTQGLKTSEEILQQSKAEVKAYLSRAESSAKLAEKRMILDAKQQMIGDIIAGAKAKFSKMPDSEYFDIILKMIKRYSLNKPGKILFSKADKKRLPEKFGEMINKSLSEKQGASLDISDETREISGGFILVYGNIEEDCSFEALFFAERELLQDKISSALFG